MQNEIDRTSLALNRQMDTIRRMEREQMEQENLVREQERIAKELTTAREIQRSVLPHIFPPFPDRSEIDLFASMDLPGTWAETSTTFTSWMKTSCAWS